MTQADTTKNLWPTILQFLFAGNSIVNNLSEPQIQLEELQQKTLQFRACLANNLLPAEKSRFVYDELKRQIQYMSLFAKELDAVRAEFTELYNKGDA
jgi:hypothetical protein